MSFRICGGLRSGAALSKSGQNNRAADSEGSDGNKGHYRSNFGRKSDVISEQGRDCKQDTQCIEPDWRPPAAAWSLISEARLQQHGDQADRSHNYNCERTEESALVGE